VSPDMKGVRKKFTGEYDEEESGERGLVIIGDVVKTWEQQTHRHFNGPAKTIVFSPSVRHGAELCRQFADAGYNFQQISYLDVDDGSRRAKIAEFRKPDSSIDGLVSCAVLTKGFDVTDVKIGISCRPYRKSFSSHIQEMGRVMRSAPGKEYGLWLAHSGNSIAFADDTAWLFEYGVESLSDGQKKDKEAREPDEKVKTKHFCGDCGIQMSPIAENCPSCGWERPQARRHAGGRRRADRLRRHHPWHVQAAAGVAGRLPQEPARRLASRSWVLLFKLPTRGRQSTTMGSRHLDGGVPRLRAAKGVVRGPM
jgi:DNA repair protein RadD